MSIDDNDERTRSRLTERVGDRAEARARAAVAEATARASRAVAQADAQARKRIADCQRPFPALPDPLSFEFPAHDAVPGLEPSLENADHPSREAIALRAYFKSEQRRFQPGCDVEDWLQAELELMAGTRDPNREKRARRG